MTTETDVNPEQALSAVLTSLREQQGIDFQLTRRVLCELAGEQALTVTDLVESTAVPRRWITDLLRALSPWLQSDETTYKASPTTVAAFQAAADCASLRSIPTDPFEIAARDATDAVRQMERYAADLPPSLWSLDHVPATPLTAVKRAMMLDSSYYLAGNHLVCLGDHDLTSLAVTLLCPEVSVTVVDIDEKILEYIAGVAAARDLPIRCLYADLRVDLPPSVRDSADLVFTDPPYTPAGLRLFVSRALACLGDERSGRVLFCYDYNERQLNRGLEIQQILQDLNLGLQAILPDFNRYTGAEAIGSSSALWVVRPTRRTWPAVRGQRLDETRIYTRGHAAEEAGQDRDQLDLADEYVADSARVVKVRSGPRPGRARRDGTVPLEELLRREPPAGVGGVVPRGATLVVDLTPYHGPYALRILLRALPFERAVLLAPMRDLQRSGLLDRRDPIRRLIAALYDLTVHPGEAPGEPARVIVEPALPPATAWEFVARYILEHRKAKVLNVWREALIALASRQGATLSKNQARALIQELRPSRDLVDSYLVELPLHALRALSEGVARSLEHLPERLPAVRQADLDAGIGTAERRR